MTAEKDDNKPAGPSEAAARREAERQAQREARLAEALRQNLKRRKQQARGRATQSEPGQET